MKCDVAIVGAGPAGLCLARALDGMGLDIRLFDASPQESLACPAEDGREIALTHASQAVLERIGVWQRLDPESLSELRDAAVFDGESARPMRITHADGGHERLGTLVSNHHIRRAAWEAVADQKGVEVDTGVTVDTTELSAAGRRLGLSDGRSVEAGLVIAADSRFSGLRRAAGIGARMRDFGRSMLLARVALEQDHEHVAWEWFGYDRTLALLPLNGRRASAVITLPHEQARRLSQVDEADFNREVTGMYRDRLGAMRLEGQRHLYPLVGVWPDRLVAERLAAVGDAAVGMHPVTAHGFNLGLTGIDILSGEMQRAAGRGQPVSQLAVLKAYQRRHRLASLPLYLATASVVGLYTDDRLPARILRRSALRVANRVAPFRQAVARQLTGKGGFPGPLALVRGSGQ
ncbi:MULTISPECIES: 5-demethoxyubiquinol-8 5-hydroxylase UbiM [unclassified Wenzhouxiangella]|uniref:5-demethoxyubiquinol-8 5-hydroxylase UbiM n=1 Tax=unclassified Wenzhouxiangella TaxID=2613841 RepID=UPI000E32A96F|nr:MULTISPECIES: 5-demethoxyubiquinol-8 5-hydroxylase UbiM [unclassified Wenzhouxiangella]RFF27358.1 FAD-dependent hydroxylase [Wenzhouxiangella sp. 15181]RFP68787.1 FAD-dependent hydroxylase [Wenzhouxiangella sp. 15190]